MDPEERLMSSERRVVRRPARPSINYRGPEGLKARAKYFALSFTTPSRFREYWLNREGAIRIAKIGGAGLGAVALVFLWYAKDLPNPNELRNRVGAQTTKFYDRTDKVLLYELYGDKNRTFVTLDEIPESLKQATVAIEDKNFYKHGAFSPAGLGRAISGVILRDSSRGGGSTITQQYVKNALLSPERSYSRKIKELILAVELEQFYSKDQILQLYLNEIPYGSTAYGVESACKTYYPHRITSKNTSKERCAKNMNLSESAILAAIPNAPSYFSPFGTHQDALIERQHLILDLMAEQTYITAEQAEGAKWKLADLDDPRKIAQQPKFFANIPSGAQHFVFYARDQLIEKYGARQANEGGLHVTTTLDLTKQDEMNKAINDPRVGISAVRRVGGSNVAMVAADPKTGQVHAMMGSYDYNDEKFGQTNVALSNRQPGSSFKPIVYATAWGLKNGPLQYGPGTTMYDVKTDFGNYVPKNYTGQFYGPLSMRQSLGNSLNIPAVKAIYIAGIKNSVDQAHKMGITTLNDPRKYDATLVLGSGEVKLNDMVNAYSSFANGGKHYKPTPFLKITDSKGKVVEDSEKPKSVRQALDAQVAYLMSNVLSDNRARAIAFGTNSPLVLPGRTAAVKTGTTNDFRDAWTVGYTPDLVTGVWVGNNDNQPMTAGGVNIAAPIWNKFMTAALKGTPDKQFERPSGIQSIRIDRSTGRVATTGSRSVTTDLFPSWYKAGSAAGGRSAVIDLVSKKLATDCTPELAKDTIYSGAIQPEIARSANPTQYALWQKAMLAAGYSATGGNLPTDQDDRHSCDDEKPTVALSGLTSEGSTIRGTATVTAGTFTPNKLEIFVGDQKGTTQTITGSGTIDFSFSTGESGSQTIKAVVTDDGYYQGSDSQTIEIKGGGSSGDEGGSFEGRRPSSGEELSAGPINFVWSPKPGATKYQLFIDGTPRGETSSTSFTYPVLRRQSHTWYVLANTGERTSPITFTIR